MDRNPLRSAFSSRSLSLFATAFLAACTVGPEFSSPDIIMPGSYRGDVSASAESIADLPWWKVYRDSSLQALIHDGLANNKDLAIAVSRVEQARQIANQTRSLALPSVGYSGGLSTGRNQSGGGAFFQDGDTKSDAVGLVNAAWEIDFWGRIRRLNEAELARYLATDEARRGVIVSLIGDIAQTYYELLELDLQKEISLSTRDSFQESFDLFQTRVEGGLSSSLETARAQAAASQAAATVPDIERLIAQKENLISVLVGKGPGPVKRSSGLGDGSDLLRVLPPGLPTALIRRRPDIRATEQLLRAANAEIGVAIAEYYPKIGLTSVAGRISPDLSNLVDSSGGVWSIAADISGPIFDGGRRVAREAQVRAEWDEARLTHEKAVLVALGEVSDSLISRQKSAEARVEQERAISSLKDAVDLATDRYTAGSSSYFEILDTKLELYPAELNLARYRANQYLSVVALYRSLGGGWSPKSISSAKAGL
ncbi:efflux transporter outer membrane subunit [Haloferula chungangensis]|uniref:Efflux transporter outer membrane subunit n=1 Tax=Haloferula chungangensis TaxID=1048331 RepID=A0ABW2L430_9BACT